MKSTLCFGFALLQLLWISATFAQKQVAVLGISTEGTQEDIASEWTQAIKEAAQTFPDWNIKPTNAGISQLTLAYGCDTPNAECLREIASGLGVDVVVFGELKEQGSLSIELTLYADGSLRPTVRASIATAAAASDQKNISHGLLSELRGERLETRSEHTSSSSQELIVEGIPGARVFIDGEARGRCDESGELRTTLTPGEHRLRVEADGYESFEQSIHEGGHHRITMVKGGSEGDINWLAFSLLGVGAVGVGLTAWSWAEISGIESNAQWKAARGAATTNEDICSTAFKAREMGLANGVSSLCGKSSTFEVLQFVFLGVGIVGLGVGTGLLIADGPVKKPQASNSGASLFIPKFAGLSLRTHEHQDGFSVATRFTF